jgi:hypothetical protein
MAMSQILKTVGNKEHHLHQGWFAVKNRSVQARRDDCDLDQRNQSEIAFFSREPWKQLSQSRVGLTSLREFLGDMVYNLLQDNINVLTHQIVSMSGAEPYASSQRTKSIDSKWTDHMRRDSHAHPYPHPVYESIHEVEETPRRPGQAFAPADLDLEAARDQKHKRPTILINACSVALTLALVLLLVALGSRLMAQELGMDGSWHRFLLLVTAPLQIFVSLVSPSRHYPFPCCEAPATGILLLLALYSSGYAPVSAY